MTAGPIVLRGVKVHNLKSIDLDIPRQKLIVLCGLSGSGKSSLALDTLYAEGQRRYIESFSAYTRQFLQRLEKPEAELIDGIPPAIAVTGKNTSRSSRSTVGTATEVADHLRLLFAKIGHVFCRQCGQEVRRDTPESTAGVLASLPPGKRLLVAFAQDLPLGSDQAAALAALREEGFVRAILDGRMVALDAPSGNGAKDSAAAARERLYVVLDRLTAGSTSPHRLRDSLETAFAKGQGRCYVFVENGEGESLPPHPEANASGSLPNSEFRFPNSFRLLSIDGRPWRRLGFSSQLACEDCGIEYPPPEPRLYSFNSPLGACPECKGFGNVIGLDMDLVVPDANKTLAAGAIAPWNTPAYAHELEELLALAADYDLPVDVPFSKLTPQQRELIVHGVPERKFGGLEGFFAWLERRKYKMHLRVFLSRWRSYRPCPACGGSRLRPEALDARIGGRNIAELAAMKVRDAIEFFRASPCPSPRRPSAG